MKVKLSWKPVIFLFLNVLFIGWLIATLSILLRVIHGEDPLALLGILAADIAFFATGILLVILNKQYRISVANRSLPFIALLCLTIVAIMNVTTISLWLGVFANVALIFSCMVTTIGTLVGWSSS
jgi:hypothetical protein